MNKILFGDCLELMQEIPDKSIDMIYADLPYGTTKCKWDTPLPLNDFIIIGKKYYYKDEFYLREFLSGKTLNDTNNLWEINRKDGLWTNYNRIIKDNGAILLFAQTPFDKVLGDSNKKYLRYEWIWEKTSATGHMNAKKMPMKAHENILVFYKKLPTYNPIMTHGHVRKVSSKKNRIDCINRRNLKEDYIYNKEIPEKVEGYDSTIRYPRSVQKFKTDKQLIALHETQKPVALGEYFIKTYTNEGDTVLDNVAGSGTTGVVCENINRNYILMDNEIRNYDIMIDRIINKKYELYSC
jgi:DNA modification methylase